MMYTCPRVGERLCLLLVSVPSAQAWIHHGVRVRQGERLINNVRSGSIDAQLTEKVGKKLRLTVKLDGNEDGVK